MAWAAVVRGRLLDTAPPPGSPEWLSRMSASKVAAVVGLSPYQSRFSLWHQMAGLIPQPEQTAVMSRGHYLEAGVTAWWADKHPEYDVMRGQSYLHQTRDWQVAAPDRLLARTDDAEVTSLLEVKTSADTDSEWGPPGSDQIPVGYRCQVQWQLDTLGLNVAHVAVLLPYLEFREYVIAYDATEAEYLAAEAQAFMESLPTGTTPQRPGIDDHDATYEAVRRMHPGIDGTDADVPAVMFHAYADSRYELDAITAKHRQAKAELLDVMGDARRALVNDLPVLRRQASGRGGVALHTIKAKESA